MDSNATHQTPNVVHQGAGKMRHSALRIPRNHRELVNVLFLVGIVVAFFVSSTFRFFSSNDQLENIYGGILITNGVFPYSGFFSQHMPLPHWVGAGLTLLSHGILWVYQIYFTAALCAWAIWLYTFLKHRVGIIVARMFLTFITVSAIFVRTNYFLAETLVAYASITIVILFLYKYLEPSYRPSLRDGVLVSALGFTIASSSLLYAFFTVIALTLFLLRFIFARSKGHRLHASLLCLGILLLPYAMLVASLVFTKSLHQFVFDALTFNRLFYAPFTSYGHSLFGWLISYPVNFFQHAIGTLQQAFNFLQLPDLLVTLGIVGFMASLLFQRKYWSFALLVVAAALLIPRNDFSFELNSTTEVFHGAPYYFLGALALANVTQWLRERWGIRPWRAIAIGWFTLTSVTVAMLVSWAYFSLQFGLQNPDRRVNPSFSRVANSLLDPSDFFWSGPSIYPDILQTQARFGSRYLHFFPWQGQCPTCVQELLDDLTQNQPKLIVFESRGLIWKTLRPAEYVEPLFVYLHDHYYQLSGRYNPNGYLYFRNDIDTQQARQAVEQAAAFIPAETIFD